MADETHSIAHVMRGQPHELEAIRAIAQSGDDRPVLMLNQNGYSEAAGYPSGEPYRQYMAVLEATVARVGGAVLWRSHVHGQTIGCDHDRVDEILAVWYPSHAAFFELQKAEGAEDMLARRKACVANAVIHRCEASAFPMQPNSE